MRSFGATSRARIVALLILFAAARVQAAEPLLGTWKMTSQTVDGHATDPDPVTLRIFKSGDGFEFDYSVPVNNINFVGTKFTSVHLDGTEGDIRDSHGQKIGIVKIAKSGPSQYKTMIQGSNRPAAVGKLSVSADGKTLTSEADATTPGKESTHAVQVFSRR
jgi:hypothetical protein